MHGCEGCRDNLLDYLYDLLDEAEAQQLRAHLDGCPACQRALEGARAQQKLLAAAARVSFPGVAFAPPPAEQIVPAPAAGVRAVLLPVKPRLNKPVRWGRWAAAAALLLAIAGLGVTAGLTGRDYSTADAVVKEKEEAVADARKAVEAANDGLLDAARQRDRRIEEIHHNTRARELRMEVQGPQTIQAGAPAEYVVRTFDLNGNPAAAEIVATLEQPVRGNSRPRSTGTYSKKKDTARDDKEKQSDDSDKYKGKEKKEEAASTAPVVREIQKGLYHVSIPASLDLRPGQSLAMSVAARRKDDTRRLSLQGAVRLTAPVYLTHLTTDKPMYQPGEFVRFRSLTVDRASLRPAAEDFRLVYSLVMPNGAVKVGPRGGNSLIRLDGKNQPSEVVGPDGKPLKGVGVGEFFLDESSPGGEWTLMLSEEYGRFPATSRKFTVNRYQKPQLDKKLEFNKPSYGPGDEVKAQASARRAGGGAVADRPVEITVTVDDQLNGPDGSVTGKPFAARTDGDGGVVAQFKLPKAIERGQATLAVKFLDAAIETIVRPIPVVLKKIDVEFFPEGGDLIAGLSNRVYFQARTPLGKPAQVSATLLEDDKPLPGKIETLSDDAQPGVNQGNGAFTFTPRKGSKYALRIDSPAGVEKTYELPKAREDGIVLHVPAGVFEANQPIRATVTSTHEGTLLVGAYCRGRLLDTVRLEKGQTEAVLHAAGGAGGVCRLTVFEEKPGKGDQRDLQPVAERLVYRHPYERLDVDLKADRRSYVPGQKVNLSVFAVNEREKLTPAVVMLAVVDKSVVTMADQKTDRSMPTHLLLTTEVRRADDLEYADFLVGQHAKAPMALDLLLGTQGWRRFAEQSPERFRERLAQQTKNLSPAERQLREEEAERLLVLIGQSTPKTTDFDQDEIDKAVGDFNDRAEVLTDKAAAATGAVEAASKDESYRSSLAKLAWYSNTAARVRSVALPVLTVAFVILLLAAVAQLASRRVGKVCLAAMACGLLLALAWVAPLGTPSRGLRSDDWRVAVLPLPQKENEALALEGDQAPDKADAGKDKGEGGGGVGQGFGGPPPAAPQPAAGGFVGGAPMPMVAKAANLRGGAGFGEGKAGMADERAHLFMFDRKGDNDAMAKGQPKGGEDIGRNKFFKADAPMKPGEKRLLEDAEDALRFKGRDGKGAGGKKRGEAKDLQAILPPFVVREYAHRHPTTTDNVRRDFAETVYWHPVLVLPDGKADVSFELCDSVTTFEAVAFAHSLDGRLGTYVKRIDSRLPFTLAPKLPIEVTATDRIDVPLTVANNTADAQKVDLSLTAHDGLKLLTGERGRKLELPSEGRGREVFSFRPSLVEGKASLRFEGKCGPFADGVEHTFRVVPDGFPITGSSSDLLEKSASHKVKLPQTWLDGTLKVRVDVYPSTLADLQKGLDGLLQEPHGCFEQSSTANYPNVLILDYLKTADKLDPQLERKVRELLARGYQKLTSFECQEQGKNTRRGYEWFGGAAPPHEALTAYGLLQFRDMAKNSEVDAAMLKRTKEYLLGQRDGNGGYKRNQRALDTFGRAPDHVTNAYVTWALSEADSDVDLTKELDSLQTKAKTTDDPYFLSLVSLSLANRGKSSEAEALLKAVAKKQKEDGGLDGAATSITGSGGQSLRIETTALAVLGWLKVNPVTFGANVRSAVKWIGQQRGGHGAFGSTQSTILALKALIAHAKANKRTPEAGEIRLFVGETKVAELTFPVGVDRPLSLELPDAHKHLVPGDNKLRVEVTGEKNVFPHTLSWTYRTTKPDSSAKAPVSLKTTLAKSELSEGDTVRLTVRVKNATGAGQGMATAIVGLPAGLSLPEDLKQLKEHVRLPKDGKRPLVSAFEVIGRELVLYWRDLAKDQEIVVPVDLVARVPGEYRGPASRAYLYYNAEVKDWVEPLAVTVKAR